MAGFDFYSMNALIKAIDSATLEECKTQLKTCVEYSKNQTIDGGKRALGCNEAFACRYGLGEG